MLSWTRPFLFAARHVIRPPLGPPIAAFSNCTGVGRISASEAAPLATGDRFKAPARERTDLQTLAGIGPKTEARLVQHGLLSVAELRKHLADNAGNTEAQAAVCLVKSFGVARHHAVSAARALYGAQRQLTFCVEGNISVGKSTFLREMQTCLRDRSGLQVDVTPEPVAMWQAVGGVSGQNILEAFYKEPARYAYTFQNYVFLTRCMQEIESRGGAAPVRLMERSVFSDRHVFVNAVHESAWLSELELTMYDSWFGPLLSALPTLVPDGFIYLRADPAVCHQRLKGRGRAEESGVNEAYLQNLHHKHEEWIKPVDQAKKNTMEVWPGVERPFLVLECDEKDIVNDAVARKSFADKLSAFYNSFAGGVEKSRSLPTHSSSLSFGDGIAEASDRQLAAVGGGP